MSLGGFAVIVSKLVWPPLALTDTANGRSTHQATPDMGFQRKRVFALDGGRKCLCVKWWLVSGYRTYMEVLLPEKS